MTPIVRIRKKDRGPQWMSISLSDDEDGTRYYIVVPCFGNLHHAGLDCWCEPSMEDGVIVHEASH